jgi:hypothetical protein
MKDAESVGGNNEKANLYRLALFFLGRHLRKLPESLQFSPYGSQKRLIGKRFGEIVVHTKLLAGSDQDLIGQAAQENEGDIVQVVEFADLFVERESAHGGSLKIDIRNDQIGLIIFEEFERVIGS